jgi:acetyltransferase-like isoleucine patch superfamily enzyme
VAINRGVQFFPAYHGNHHIRLGNDVYLAPNVCFFASGHDINDLTRLVGDDIVIGDHVWIGANAIIYSHKIQLDPIISIGYKPSGCHT